MHPPRPPIISSSFTRARAPPRPGHHHVPSTHLVRLALVASVPSHARNRGWHRGRSGGRCRACSDWNRQGHRAIRQKMNACVMESISFIYDTQGLRKMNTSDAHRLGVGEEIAGGHTRRKRGCGRFLREATANGPSTAVWHTIQAFEAQSNSSFSCHNTF